jgi:hypothetical protein
MRLPTQPLVLSHADYHKLLHCTPIGAGVQVLLSPIRMDLGGLARTCHPLLTHTYTLGTASSTSRTFRAIAELVNGFCRKSVPSGTSPLPPIVLLG